MKYIISLLLFSLTISLWAGSALPKFGKPDERALKLTHCSFDSSALAVYIAKTGAYHYAFVEGKGFCLIFEGFQRIKILGQSSVDKGDLELIVGKQDEFSLEAVTINQEKAD